MMTTNERLKFDEMRAQYAFARKMCRDIYGKIYDFVEKTDPGALDDIMTEVVENACRAVEAAED